jgi:predicted nucleic acid-binding protein
MSLFLDTGVLVATANPRDANHRTASRLLRTAGTGRFGDILTSDYIFDESVTLAFARTRRADLAIRVGELILGTGDSGRVMGMAFVSPRALLRAWARFQRLAPRGLSFTDCTSLEVIESMGIDEIASFDRDFDGLVPRRAGVEGE